MMTEADDEMFAGMIAAAISPDAREVKPTKKKEPAAKNGCPCGSGQHGYKLYDHSGQFLLFCCFKCEKERRRAV